MRQKQEHSASWAKEPLVVPPRRRDVRTFAIDEEATLLDPQTGSRFYLNQTAWRVWNRCNGRHSADQIARGLAESFEAPFDSVVDDVEQLVAMFADAGLLQAGTSG